MLNTGFCDLIYMLLRRQKILVLECANKTDNIQKFQAFCMVSPTKTLLDPKKTKTEVFHFKEGSYESCAQLAFGAHVRFLNLCATSPASELEKSARNVNIHPASLNFLLQQFLFGATLKTAQDGGNFWLC